jgi:hypothetical protein
MLKAIDAQIEIVSDNPSTRDYLQMFLLNPKNILKEQSSSSMIQYNGQVGTQRQNIQTH